MAILFIIFALLLAITKSIEKDPDVGRDMIEIVTNKVCCHQQKFHLYMFYFSLVHGPL